MEIMKLTYLKEISPEEATDVVNNIVLQSEEDCVAILAPADMVDICTTVNAFPECVGPDEFIGAIKLLENLTGIEKSGFWWEVLENCLSVRIGSSRNCL